VRHLTCDQLRILWHQRLGHLHNQRLKLAACAATGLLDIGAEDKLHKCPICSAAKLHKPNKGTEDSPRATVCNQGISIDAGFIVQSSKDSKRVAKYTGLHGETCCFLIVDHKSGTVYGDTFASKAPPIEFINWWLAQHALGQDVLDKYVRMDLGGELGSCPEVVNLLERSSYKVETTAAQSLSQNGPGDWPHQTIANAMQSMLVGAGLPAKFWPYDFRHYLRLYNLIHTLARSNLPMKSAAVRSQISVNSVRSVAVSMRSLSGPTTDEWPSWMMTARRVFSLGLLDQ
jgi:GAG-pre-integrase domain